MLYYALYLLMAAFGWARVFNIQAQWFGWYSLWWHYMPFGLFVAFGMLFHLEFLQLDRNVPRLARLSRLNLLLSLLILPVGLFALPYAFMLTNVALLFGLVVALWAGAVRLRQGFLPARYFLAAFIALALSGAVHMPSGLGMLSITVRSTEIWVVLATAIEAILLAFALADKIRLMTHQKDEYLEQLNRALHQASTDHLTGIPNRYAFDRALQALSDTGAMQRLLLTIIDLDGLKRINDTQGHIHGDALLCEFAKQLKTLNSTGLSVYRLGGDEFAVVGEKHQEEAVRRAMAQFESALLEVGFGSCGISYGIAFGAEAATSSQLLKTADTRMYAHKAAKRNDVAPSLF